jgi:hypothetical protein
MLSRALVLQFWSTIKFNTEFQELQNTVRNEMQHVEGDISVSSWSYIGENDAEYFMFQDGVNSKCSLTYLLYLFIVMRFQTKQETKSTVRHSVYVWILLKHNHKTNSTSLFGCQMEADTCANSWNVHHELYNWRHEVQSFSEANRHSFIQEILRLLWNPTVHYRVLAASPCPEPDASSPKVSALFP